MYIFPAKSLYAAVASQNLAELESCVNLTDGPSSSSTSAKRYRLHSPLSPARSLEYLSSDSKPSSPTRGNGSGPMFGGTTSSSSLSSPRSVESSLKLVLSPTSWSRSSSSSWSPTPEPDTGTKLHKGKTIPTQKPRKYTKKSLLKVKLSAEVSTTEAKPKGKRGRPRKYPPKEITKTPPKFGKGGRGRGGGAGLMKGGRAPKTYTKASLQYHGAKIFKRKQHRPGRGGGQSAGRGLLRPMSPEAALVLHDHCYMDQMSQQIVAEAEDGDTATYGQSTIRSRSGDYSVYPSSHNPINFVLVTLRR